MRRQTNIDKMQTHAMKEFRRVSMQQQEQKSECESEKSAFQGAFGEVLLPLLLFVRERAFNWNL